MPYRINIYLLLYFCFAFFYSNLIWGQTVISSYDLISEEWVDSVFKSLNKDEKIGQLFMVAAFSNKTEKHEAQIQELITKQNIGGLIFFQGGPVRQALLTNKYQQLSKVPLLIGMDAEWGLGMRLDKDSVISFPKQMTLGAITDNSYIYEMGEEIARQCRRLGVHVNFAPVADINSNASNPVIGMRSFGEKKENVARKATAYSMGMQHNKVIANAKHFPGHGDTDSDSHMTLPTISHNKERIENTELFPFKRLISDSIKSMMVAHIFMPAYDSTANTASTLSKAIVKDLLRDQLQFDGLIFTDALNMKSITNFYKPGQVEVVALAAGNDILLYPEDVPQAIKKINKAIKDGTLSEEDINLKVKKILKAKFWAGLSKNTTVKIKNLYEELNTNKAKALQMALYSKALTVVKNSTNLLPVKMIDTTSIATISIGLEQGNSFQEMADNYAEITHFSIPKNMSISEIDTIVEKLKTFEIVLVGVHGTSSFNNKDYGINENTKLLVESINLNTNAVITIFGNPYSLKNFTSAKNLICAYEDNKITQMLVPQLIFGGITSEGRLPVTANDMYKEGVGLTLDTSIQRLAYALPENAKMNSETLQHIDTIVWKAIQDGATPGCQVIVAKDGMVVFDKSYGYFSYDQKEPVTKNTIYDIASISKVAGTLQAFMFLEERGLIDLNKKASEYLPELKKTNKEDLIVRDILVHQAGLIPYIPHWKRTLDTSGFMSSYYCTSLNDTFCLEVIPGLFSLLSMEDSLWKWSIDSELLKKPKRQKNYEYVYSDIGFYIVKKIVEKVLNEPMNNFLQQNYYDALGLKTMTYRPLFKFPISRITPTEDDKVFRKSLVRGTVHDQGAALLGGVAGHAGIFSNANDLAILMQMNLNNGTYGGMRYFLPATLQKFTSQQFPKNRRGLGWDKPEPAGHGPTSDYASSNTYGHTGFTGTAAWVDPDHNLVYIFLSNRVHPDANNNKLARQNVRTNIQDYIYKAIINYE